MNPPLLLTFNAGSATVKIGLFAWDVHGARRIGKAVIDLGLHPPRLTLDGVEHAEIRLHAAYSEDLHEILDEAMRHVSAHLPLGGPAAAGHRVVHGGDRFAGPVRLDDAALTAIEALTPLAPLHQPRCIRLMRAIRRLHPALPQTASFDTAFHRTQSDLVRRFALPRALEAEGIRRYGFHGLSYRFVARELRRRAPDIAEGRVIVAHLGSGASLCALQGGASRDTSMGFSTLDGIPMSTRCGALDPGVLLHLLTQRGLSPQAVEHMLYHESGLLGLSGISGDSRDLLASPAPEARAALELFCFRIAREVAALANTIGGLEALVFTAGIGEHQPAIRAGVCAHLGWLGLRLDAAANAAGRLRLEASDSDVAVLTLATDEEQIIADEAVEMLAREGAQPVSR
ncbi:acetate/propionate family kinase [Roseomonas sp. E05]|uniref:acetate/propionate family kinase n=1 Tax=Roseomonas sp. E05 TaxID=3046310 RepID=UPI0024B97FF0|nr:acetate/propionate family kinase [Roseomonas sp. E05]MDJ0388441.1 acetate/propionate family kinase [Roseomonas sp. E05]